MGGARRVTQKRLIEESMATETQFDPNLEPDGVMSRAAMQVRQFMCGLQGHDTLMHFERGRMSLQCMSCGYQTPGWDVRKTPTQHHDIVEANPQVPSMPFLGERRVA